MSREYAIALGARLRAVRRQHGMTLEQVHQRSGGRWSRVLLGCYERADRAVSVTTLVELAAIYGVRTEDLLPTEPAPAAPRRAAPRQPLPTPHRESRTSSPAHPASPDIPTRP